MYPHEQQERKANTEPMCTVFPPVALGTTMMQDYLAKRHLSFNLAIMNGWYESENAGDKYTRVVIPAVTHMPGHRYWQARDMTGKAYLRYQSPKGPRHEALIHVSPSDAEFDTERGTVIVEGPMDALAAAGEGYLGIALMGMTPSAKTILHLVKLVLPGKPVLILLDRDSQASGPRLSWKLAAHGVQSHNACLPGPEKDLSACLPKKRKQFLASVFKSLSFRKSSVKGRSTGTPV